MTPIEIAIWSACAGVYLSYFSLSCFYAAYNRSASGLQTAAFIGFSGFYVVMCSGLAEQFVPGLSKATHANLLLASGPISAAIAAYGLRSFLRAHQRDSIIDIGSLVICAWCALQLLAFFWVDRRQALEMVGLNLVLASVGSFWMSTRSWLQGDRYALAMSIACAAMVFAVMGLYAHALEMLRSDLWLQFFSAVCAALFVVISSHTLKRRYTEFLRMRRALTMSRDKDLLTQLWTGAALVHKVDEAVARARRNRKEMAVICIEVANTSKLNQEFGNHGLEQVIYGMAARVRQAAGSTATVGRYSDTSFMVVFDSIKKAAVLRTIGLRLAISARRPFVLNPYSSSPRDFRAEIGVGVARIAPGRETRKRQERNSTQMGGFDSLSLAQDVLHEASELALAARAFNSRTAIMDSYSRKTVALELAELA
jgi:GGDEF domain-containing protein